MAHHNYFDDVIKFFQDPMSYTQDGNSSRLGYWETINVDKACIDIKKGIVPFLTVHTYNKETCQSLCQHNNDCMAVDFVKNDHRAERADVWKNALQYCKKDGKGCLFKPCHLHTTACTNPGQNVGN